MVELTGYQRKYLRSRAHHLTPVVYIGRQGLTDNLVAATATALAAHELIKVKFNDFKEARKELSAELAERTDSDRVGLVGNIAILYRPHDDVEKRRIFLPPA